MKPSSQEKKKFVEERARRILFNVYPEIFKNSYLSESPDIQSTDGAVCVEVTDSFTNQYQESMSRTGDIAGKTKSQLTKINKINIEKGRVTARTLPNGEYAAAFALWGDNYNIRRAYNSKLKKLNSAHFQKCRENNLFIYAWFIDDDDLFSSIQTIQQLYRAEADYSVHFHTVYLFTGSQLIEINLKSSQVQYHAIREEILSEISHRSFETIMGMSREEYRRRNQPNT